MMPIPSDIEARRRALLERSKSLLVEAGAGSGKTALMAGRVVLLLAEAVEPRSIAAITFTELAAAELAQRIRTFAERLLEGEVPPELQAALPHGLSAEQMANLHNGLDKLDDLTSTTIHGFALDLIRPYPAEAELDPGARPMDAGEASLLFTDVFETWLRERLSKTDDGADVVAQLFLVQRGDSPLKWLRSLTDVVMQYPGANVPEADGADVTQTFEGFAAAVDAYTTVVHSFPYQEEESIGRATALRDLCSSWEQFTAKPVRLAVHAAFDRPSSVFTGTATMRKRAGTKKAWHEASKAAGASKADAERAYGDCKTAYEQACDAFEPLEAASAGLIVDESLTAVREVIAAYATRKRDGALLDFDDMLHKAVHLLERHEGVRDALARRYLHVLVDEFQDTDPIQAEIVWRLTGEPAEDRRWLDWPARGGSRFVVGDPKQSIYRFRRADVHTYLELRSRVCNDPSADEVSVMTNFRCRPAIVDATNLVFESPLSDGAQPGYTRLKAFRDEESVAVARIELPLPDNSDPSKTPSADVTRDVEAREVAALCARLIHGDSGLPVSNVVPSDIALLAPTGTELWRYELELDQLGIPVSSQAGKGFYQRQEIQDLIALTRALADIADRAALGALLRGPLVGATEEQLLDVASVLQDQGQRPLSLLTDPEAITDSIIRRVIERLAPLARRALARTPHQTLSAALEQLEVRPLLKQRHGGRAERALANVELFLESSQPWAVRGLRAFARDAYARWHDGESTQEGRPESAEGAVTLITVHSAKGLEWKVVIPINMMRAPRTSTGPFVDRDNHRLWIKAGHAQPAGFEEARLRDDAERQAENIRLLYVAATRARDLLVIPKPTWPMKSGSWLELVDFESVDAPSVTADRADPLPSHPEPERAQDAEVFLAEAKRIQETIPRIIWSSPSRHDALDEAGALSTRAIFDDQQVPPEKRVFMAEVASEAEAHAEPPSSVPSGAAHQIPAVPNKVVGRGRLRGLVLHALMEELITGEAREDTLQSRASELVEQAGSAVDGMPHLTSSRPDPGELAQSALRAWSLDEVSDLRDNLVAEWNVYGSAGHASDLKLIAGIADAVALDDAGRPYCVIDWKSDVDPTPEMVESYTQQVRDYLRMTGAARGMLVFATPGFTVEVQAD